MYGPMKDELSAKIAALKEMGIIFIIYQYTSPRINMQ